MILKIQNIIFFKNYDRLNIKLIIYIYIYTYIYIHSLNLIDLNTNMGKNNRYIVLKISVNNYIFADICQRLF